MASVLGKRSRGSSDLPSSSARRSKRQATTAIYSDENEPPQDVQGHDDESMELDELSLIPALKTRPISISRPVLAVAKKIRSLVSPVKHFEDENEHPLQLRTPQTPRHPDALSKKVPITPRHRVTFTGKPLAPSTPRTPSTPSNFCTVYQPARQLFTRSSDPGKLVGRENECREITDFINGCIEKTSGGCTYVSGPPGTGKSALVNEVTSNLAENDLVKKAYVNCMSMKTSKDIYTTLLDDLCQDLEVREGEEVQTLQGMFAPRKRSSALYVVTLDEIDHILTLDLEFMYKLFEWSLQKSSHLVLIGIANALDLTDRFLPRLKARNLKPQLLPILPYNATQIKAVIITRLKSLLPANTQAPDYIPFLHPAAIELCSRKVSSQTGDLRKAFDICRRAIELIESETKNKHQQAADEQIQNSPSRKPLGENANLSSPVKPSPTKMAQSKSLASSLAGLTAETAPRASIAHLNKITSSTLGNGTSQRLKTLNLQQKAALCALVALEKRKRIALSNVMATPSKSNTAAPTVKALYDTYCMLCRRDSVLHPLTNTEFRDVVGSLETLSLISAVDGKSGSFVGLNTPSKRGRKGFGCGVGIGDEKRVGSCVGERELNQAAEGLGASILKSILSGEGLD